MHSGLLQIESRAWSMIMRAVRLRPQLEVYGAGHAVVDYEDGVLVLDDIYIPPQEVTPGNFHVTGDAFMTALTGLVKEYGDRWTEWCVMWHSHSTMPTLPSTVDTDNLANMVTNNLDYVVGLVVNVKGDASAWAELNIPWRAQVELDVEVIEPDYPELSARVDEWMKEVKEKPKPVVKPVVPLPYYASGPDLEGIDGLDDGSAASFGVTLADVKQKHISPKAVDRLARAILRAGEGELCSIKQSGISCVLVNGHRPALHVGLHEGVPAYFQANGHPPTVKAIKEAGFPA